MFINHDYFSPDSKTINGKDGRDGKDGKDGNSENKVYGYYTEEINQKKIVYGKIPLKFASERGLSTRDGDVEFDESLVDDFFMVTVNIPIYKQSDICLIDGEKWKITGTYHSNDHGQLIMTAIIKYPKGRRFTLTTLTGLYLRNSTMSMIVTKI